MAELVYQGNMARNDGEQPEPGARRAVYVAGTDALAALYSDAHLTDPTENPMTADAAGRFDHCHLRAGSYRIKIQNASGRLLQSEETIAVSETETGFVRSFTTASDLLDDTTLSYEASHGKLRVAPGDLIYVSHGDHQYEVQESGSAHTQIVTAGGVEVCVSCLSDQIDVTAFGAVGDGVTDNTVAIQRAINAASWNDVYTISLPKGHFIYDALYAFYDETLNPGYRPDTNPNRQGRIRLIGDGSLAISQIRNYAPDYGTILEATGDGLIIASEALGQGGDPYPARKFEAEGISFVANKANGYVIEAASCPLIYLNRCVVYQRHVDGHGIFAKSSWYADFEHTMFFGAPASTGTGIAAGTDIFGGLYTFRNCVIDSWRDGFDWQNGVFSNVSFQNSSVQNCLRNGIRGSNGALRHLELSNVYFEGSSRECDIRGIGSTIKSLKIDQMFVLGGGGDGGSYITDKVIDLDEVSSLDITGVFAFRLFAPFCHVGAVDNYGVHSGSVNHVSISNDLPHTGDPIFLFSGVLPEFGGSISWPDFHLGYYDPTPMIRLFDPEVATPTRLTDRRTGAHMLGSLALGGAAEFTGQTSALPIAPNDPRTLVRVDVATGLGVAVRLPDQGYVVDGRMFLVENLDTSIGDLVVRNNSDNSLVQVLKAGQSSFVLFDAALGRYRPFQVGQTTPQPDIIALNDNTGGTAGAALNAISGSGADVGINSNFASLNAKLDAVLDGMRSAGVLS